MRNYIVYSRVIILLLHKVYIKQRSIIPFVDIGRIIDHLRLNFLFMKHFNITRALFLPVELKPYCINTNAEEYSMLAINKIILIICVVCCRPLSYVPNVTSVSGLSTLDYSYSFLSRLYTIIILVFLTVESLVSNINAFFPVSKKMLLRN